MTFLIWWLWLDRLGDVFYSLMLSLPEGPYCVMNQGFDAEVLRLDLEFR